MASRAIKEQVELEVFKSFAQVCPLNISLQSIQKCQPPQPDILCDSGTQGRAFFELVELTDEKFNFDLFSKYELRKLFEEAAQKRPNYRAKYANACVWVLFKPRIKSSKRYIEKILDLLLSDCIPENFKGDVISYAIQSPRVKDLCNDWIDKMDTLEVYRNTSWEHQVPCFNTKKMEKDHGGRVRDRIEEKFRKSYDIHPINQAELLGYFAHHPPPLSYDWMTDVNEFVRNNIRISNFRRVWIFDTVENTILYSFRK